MKFIAPLTALALFASFAGPAAAFDDSNKVKPFNSGSTVVGATQSVFSNREDADAAGNPVVLGGAITSSVTFSAEDLDRQN